MRYASDYLWDKASVLIPRKGSLNNILYVDEPFWSVDTMFWTQLTDEVTAKFLYLEIKNIDFSAQDTGTSIPSNSTKQLNCIEIKIPPAEALNALDKMLLPLFELRKTNLKEISEIDFFRQMILSELGS